VSIDGPDMVAHVILDKPETLNTMTKSFWPQLHRTFQELDRSAHVRAVILSASLESKVFSAGLDLSDAAELIGNPKPRMGIGRKALQLRQQVQSMQQALEAIAKCRVPVIAAIHGACIGGGVDLVSTCDIRLVSKDAYFSIKEVDLAIAADLGTLSRLPKLVGNDSLVRELAFTGRSLAAEQALQLGFVSRVCSDPQSLMEEARVLAKNIASESPIAVIGTKAVLNYSRDHSISDGLEFVSIWNMAMLQSDDVIEAVSKLRRKETPQFSKL